MNVNLAEKLKLEPEMYDVLDTEHNVLFCP